MSARFIFSQVSAVAMIPSGPAKTIQGVTPTPIHSRVVNATK